MDYIGAGDLVIIGGAQHIHRNEGRNKPSPGCAQTHRRTHPCGSTMHCGAAGWRSSQSGGRVGRRTNSKAQTDRNPGMV
jgi:hypothetical protein